MRFWLVLVPLAGLALTASPPPAQAVDYPYPSAEPQKTGWPLNDDELKFVLRPEYERRPGAEASKHLPEHWPTTPAAGYWGQNGGGDRAWLDCHAKLVKQVQGVRGPVDVLLVGDSITQQWGGGLDGGQFNAAWRKQFGERTAVNIGIGGDKTQNVLWRLDHGGVDGLQPRVAVLLVGNNNMFFAPETGVAVAARGVQVCAANLREKFPKATVVVVKILPAHGPGVAFYEDIKKTNGALDSLKLDADANVRVLDLTADFLEADGSLKKELYSPDKIHLSAAGYAVFAERLRPEVERALEAKPADPK